VDWGDRWSAPVFRRLRTLKGAAVQSIKAAEGLPIKNAPRPAVPSLPVDKNKRSATARLVIQSISARGRARFARLRVARSLRTLSVASTERCIAYAKT
jgi:hypothetical protein